MKSDAFKSGVVRAVDVYPYRREREVIEFLLLRRAPDMLYSGTWRMVGGKIQPGERAWTAALRELYEETQRSPRRFWTVPSVNSFYEWQYDRVNLIPAFAAELNADPVLDQEHDAFRWLQAEEAAERLAWPEQGRLVRLIDKLLRQGLQVTWRIPLEASEGA